MKILKYKDNDKINFYSFLGNNMALASLLFAHLLEDFNFNERKKIEEGNFSFTFRNYDFKINEKDIDYFKEYYKEYKEKYFSKRDAEINSNEKDFKFESYVYNLKYLIKNIDYEKKEILFDKFKIVKVFRDDFCDFTLEDPILLSQTIKSSLKDIMGRVYDKDDNHNELIEKSFLDFTQESISLNKITDDKLNYYFENNKLSDNYNKEDFILFFEDIINKTSAVFKDILFIKDAFNARTNKVIEFVNSSTEKLNKKKILFDYLNESKKTLSNFKNRDTNNIYNYIRVIDVILKHFKKIVCYNSQNKFDNEKINDIYFNWKMIKNNLQKDFKLLLMKIEEIIKELKTIEDDLTFKDDLNSVFKEFIFDSEIEATKKQKIKNEKFSDWLEQSNDYINFIPKTNLVKLNSVIDREDDIVEGYVRLIESYEYKNDKTDEEIDSIVMKKEIENKENLQKKKDYNSSKRIYDKKITKLSQNLFDRILKRISYLEIDLLPDLISDFYFDESFVKKMKDTLEGDVFYNAHLNYNSIEFENNQELFKIREKCYKKLVRRII